MPISVFTPEQKRSLLIPFIKKGLEQGLSATRMYEMTRGTALGIRKKDFLGLVREITGRQKRAEDTIKYTRTEYLFPSGVDVVDWNLKKPFLYRAKLLFEGEEEPRVFSLYSDSPLLPKVAESMILSNIEESSFAYQEEIGIAGKKVISSELVAPAVSREFSPSWLRKRFGF